MRPFALDLFCCAGGASRGLVDAGFDVVGVDVEAQPEDPYTMLQCDAFAALHRLMDGGVLETRKGVYRRNVTFAELAMIWASPPCQHHSQMTRQSGRPGDHPDLIASTRRALMHARVLSRGRIVWVQSIPPAYAKWIGARAIAKVK